MRWASSGELFYGPENLQRWRPPSLDCRYCQTDSDEEECPVVREIRTSTPELDTRARNVLVNFHIVNPSQLPERRVLEMLKGCGRGTVARLEAWRRKKRKNMPTLLHAACGPATLKTLDWMQAPTGKLDPNGAPIIAPLFAGWTEVRLDIDDQYGADIVGDMRDETTWRPQCATSYAAENPFDAVFCSHALEHLHLYDAPKCLATFRSVLKADGRLYVVVPNFEAACRHIIEGRGEKLYDSPAGPIFAHEVIFGKELWTHQNLFQRHLTGYTPDLLRGIFVGAGFKILNMSCDKLNLLIVGSK